MQDINDIESSQKQTPFTGKKMIIKRIIEVIRENQPIRADVLKAKLTVNDPFISEKRAKEYIINLKLAGNIDYKEDKDGAAKICLSKN